MPPALRLYEDVLSNNAEATLPARPRMIFVVHGSVTVAGRTLQDGEAWSGEGAEMLKAGSAGAALWRWDLVSDGANEGAASGKRVMSAKILYCCDFGLALSSSLRYSTELLPT